MKLAIDQILISDKTRVRAKVDKHVVDEYAAAIQAGDIFPPVVVFAEKGSQRFFLADGEYRILACLKLDKKTVGVEVKIGTVHDALHYALSANARHGMRRTSADKHHVVELALGDPYYAEWSLREIGELCCVSKDLVRTIKEEQNQKAAGVFKDSKPENNKRPCKKKPTQAEVDLKLLRGALAVIKGFPYSGEGLAKRLGLTPDDEIDLKYCVEWLNEALQAHVDAVHADPGSEMTDRHDEYAT